MEKVFVVAVGSVVNDWDGVVAVPGVFLTEKTAKEEAVRLGATGEGSETIRDGCKSIRWRNGREEILAKEIVVEA